LATRAKSASSKVTFIPAEASHVTARLNA
jgi:hypothetical protein